MTRSTLTVDSNVLLYAYQHQHGHRLAQGLDNADRIDEFCNLLDETPIAVNEGIRSEYGDTIGPEWAKEWLARRGLRDLVVEIQPSNLPRQAHRILEREYGYGGICAMDRHFLKTCNSVRPKPGILVSHNDQHMRVTPRRLRPMCDLLLDDCGVMVVYVDECLD